MAKPKPFHCPTNREEFEELKRNPRKLLQLLYKTRLLRVVDCKKCKQQCRIRECNTDYDRATYKMGYYQYCTVCYARYQLTKGSYFYGSALNWNQHLELLYCIYFDESIKNVVEKLGISKKIAIKYFKFYKRCFSKVVDEYYSNHELGDQHIVEIDESLTCKKYKHQRGHKGEEIWTLCMHERGTMRYRFCELGQKKTRKEIIPMIEKYVAKGTQIYTDQYSVYLILGSIGYKHYAINHQHRFACPFVIGANTNGVEGAFGISKAKFKEMKGCHRNYLQIYLDTFTFRKLYRGSEIGLFGEMLIAIGRMQDCVKLE